VYFASEVPPGSGQYFVQKDCVRDDAERLVEEHGSLLDPVPLGYPVDQWIAQAGTPQDLLAEALALLHPDPPQIGTFPSGVRASAVDVPTRLWLVGGLAPVSHAESDGPLTVTVTATPVKVTWNAGDNGSVTCSDTLGVGAPDEDICTVEYTESSVEQTGRDAFGRPAYILTATIEYIGSYTVTFNGTPVTSNSNIGAVAPVSTTEIAVEELQAVNTPAPAV
jgi:hypothetical protein